MEEIKRRIAVINTFVSGNVNALYKVTTIESVYLQFRKILEIIALGSMIANKNEFSRFYKKFSDYWNANKLLKALQYVNLDFYPRPIIEIPSKNPSVKMEWQDKKDGFLTKSDFVKLYKNCGRILHIDDPYSPKVDYDYYTHNIQTWLDKIMSLLNSHTIKLIKDPNIYLVHMLEKDSKVHFYVFAPTI